MHERADGQTLVKPVCDRCDSHDSKLTTEDTEEDKLISLDAGLVRRFDWPPKCGL
jgi:hypothetical protein